MSDEPPLDLVRLEYLLRRYRRTQQNAHEIATDETLWRENDEARQAFDKFCDDFIMTRQCAHCGRFNVKVEEKREKFGVGSLEEAPQRFYMVMAQVEVHSCSDCGESWTTAYSETQRTRAVLDQTPYRLSEDGKGFVWGGR